jgi:hypothetical protein
MLPYCEFLNKQFPTLDTICYFCYHAVYINMQAPKCVACIFIDSTFIEPTNAQYLMLTLFSPYCTPTCFNAEASSSLCTKVY